MRRESAVNRSAGEVERQGTPGRRRARGGRLRDRGREPEVAQDPLNHERILDRRDEAQTAAAGAGENINLENAPEQLGP